MHRSVLLRRLPVAIAILVALGAGAQICRAQSGGGAVRSEMSEMLRKHDEALNKHDLEAVVSLFAPGAKTVVLGTGAGERFEGRDGIRAAYTEIFKDFDKGTSTHNCYWKQGGGTAQMVWGAAQCKFTDSKGGKPREYELNVSGVLQKQAGKWYFVMLHYSNLTGTSTQ
jgi:uncharacterized protein (TIGR02246 family)